MREPIALIHRLAATAGLAAGLAVVLGGSLAACAPGEAAEQIANDVSVVDGTVLSCANEPCEPDAAAGDEGVVVQQVGIIDETKSIACTTERANLEQVVEMFNVMEGRAPAAEVELIPDYLRSESTMFDLSPEGAVVAAPGSDCA